MFTPPQIGGGVRLPALGLGGKLASRELNMQLPLTIYIKNTQKGSMLASFEGHTMLANVPF